MSESLTCNICGKMATVHLTQIIKSKMHKIDLCEKCAQQKGVHKLESFSLEKLLVESGQKSTEPPAEERLIDFICKKCGYTGEQFKKVGRFGCPHCYERLNDTLLQALETVHKNLQHKGKVPLRACKRITLKRELDDLGCAIQKAIKEERYEEAAQYRDKIEQLKLTLKETEEQKLCTENAGNLSS